MKKECTLGGKCGEHEKCKECFKFKKKGSK